MNAHPFSTWIRQLRLERNLTMEQVGSLLGVTPIAVLRHEEMPLSRTPQIQTIIRFCNAFGLDPNDHKWRFGHPLVTLTTRQHQILEGFMLGDGHLTRRTKNSLPSLSIGRTLEDKDYQEWTAKEFADFRVRMNDYTRINSTTGNYQSVCALGTGVSTAFDAYHNRWYKNRVKVVPSDLKLSPLTVAVWLADDGYVRGGVNLVKTRTTPKKMGRPSFNITLATNGFTKEEVVFLAALLNARYGGGFYLSSTSGDWVISAPTSPSKLLLRDIDASFPPLSRKSDIWRTESVLWQEEPNCPLCGHSVVWRQGHFHNGRQRWSCAKCKHYFCKRVCKHSGQGSNWKDYAPIATPSA